MTTHRLRCQCGRLTGEVDVSPKADRGTCYCKDCQAFAYFLGRSARVLDRRGGTEIVQTSPQALRFTAGRDHIACVRLRPAGLLRWYSDCCRTPIGNTAPDYRLSFVGLIHVCLDDPSRALDESFGASRMRVHTGSAVGEPKPSSRGLVGAGLRLGGMLLRARLTGAYRRTPFFSADGVPVAIPQVLSTAALDSVMAEVARHGTAAA